MAGLVIDDVAGGTFRANRRALVDPVLFDAEFRTIFNKCWLYLGHEAEIPNPGDFRTRLVGGRNVVFIRNRSGSPMGLLNACSHRGTPVCRDRAGNARRFTCPYHAWTFDNAGSLIGLPGTEDLPASFNKAENGLKAFRTDSYRGFVFITFNPDAESLLDYLGDAAGYLDLFPDQEYEEGLGLEIIPGTYDYSANCNWKLLSENMGDGYHAPFMHQRYFDMLKSAGAMRLSAANVADRSYLKDLGKGHGVIQGNTGSWGKSTNEPLERARAARRRRLEERHGQAYTDRMLMGSRSLMIFPNLGVIDLGMAMMIRVIEPISPVFTTVQGYHLAPRGEPEILRSDRLESFPLFWGPAGMATPDDVEILELIQESIGRGEDDVWQEMSKGLGLSDQSMQQDFLLRNFWRRWAEMVLGQSPCAEPHDLVEDLSHVRSLRQTAPAESA